MPILNYTTKITTDKTIGEIQKMLARIKAKSVLTEYDDNSEICALSFQIATPTGVIGFRLPSNTKGVHESLCNSRVERRYRTEEQANRVAWRIIKDWVEAQIALIEAEIADTVQVFLPYALMGEETIYDTFKDKQFKALTNKE